MSHLQISEVQGDTLASRLDFDIICSSVLRNFLNEAHIFDLSL